MASFTELEIWKQARKIRIIVANMVKYFPSEKKFRLAATYQMFKINR
jgi:hypothetical protein